MKTDMKMEDLSAVAMQTQRALRIHLSSGTGEGPTPLAAFDAALAHAGIGWGQGGDDGRGLFVELHYADRDRLDGDLHTTLGAMRRSRGDVCRPSKNWGVP